MRVNLSDAGFMRQGFWGEFGCINTVAGKERRSHHQVESAKNLLVCIGFLDDQRYYDFGGGF